MIASINSANNFAEKKAENFNHQQAATPAVDRLSVINDKKIFSDFAAFKIAQQIKRNGYAIGG
jgi:hypothetical protein